MSSPIVSRWPVLLALDVRPEDRDEDGVLSDPGAERLVAIARDAYFDLCSTVDRSSLEVRSTRIRSGMAPVTDVVSVSTGVVEVFKESFTMSVRIRPAGSEGVVADVLCTLSTGAEIPASMRDEFIALAHGALHVH